MLVNKQFSEGQKVVLKVNEAKDGLEGESQKVKSTKESIKE